MPDGALAGTGHGREGPARRREPARGGDSPPAAARHPRRRRRSTGSKSPVPARRSLEFADRRQSGERLPRPDANAGWVGALRVVGFSPEIQAEAIAESGARAKTAVQEKQSSRRFPVFHRKLT